MGGQAHSVGHIVLTGIVEEEDGQFASYCRELGTASCGDTITEALENLREAIEINIEGLEEVGELERTLRERNIKVRYMTDRGGSSWQQSRESTP